MATMDIAEVAAFLELVKTGSVLVAAKNMKLSRATLRRRIESIEREIGRPLFERQHEEVVLTRAGKLLEREGATLLGSARRLEGALKQVGAETVSGSLTVALPIGLPGVLFTAFARALAEQWPNLRVEGLCAQDPLAELEREADVAVTSGPRPSAPWVARSLADVEERAYVHESYIERAGVPRSLAELGEHRLLTWRSPDRDTTQWPLRRGGSHRVEPVLVFNDLVGLQECIEAGLGIGLVTIPPQLPGVRVVMPTVIGARVRFWLASAPAGRWSPSVRAFARELVPFIRMNVKQQEIPIA